MPNASLLRVIVLLGTAGAVPTPSTAQISKGATPEELMAGGGTVIEVLDKRFTPEALQAFLKQRTPGEMFGSFTAYASLLYSLHSVASYNSRLSRSLSQLFPINRSTSSPDSSIA